MSSVNFRTMIAQANGKQSIQRIINNVMLTNHRSIVTVAISIIRASMNELVEVWRTAFCNRIQSDQTY